MTTKKSKDILVEIYELEEIVRKGHDLLKDFSDSYAIQLALQEDEFRLSELYTSFQEAVIQEKKHTFCFIIKNIDKYTPIAINRLSESLLAFQNAMNAISKRIFKNDETRVQFLFNFSFPSSFGIQLSTGIPDYELFSKTYTSIEYFVNVLESMNEDSTILDSIKEQEKNSIVFHRIKDFYKTQSDFNNDVELVWGDTTLGKRSIKVTKERAKYIFNLLDKYDYIPDITIEIKGKVLGISLIKNRVDIAISAKETISASANDKLILLAKDHFNSTITARCTQHRKLNAKTEDYVDTYELLEIFPEK